MDGENFAIEKKIEKNICGVPLITELFFYNLFIFQIQYAIQYNIYNIYKQLQCVKMCSSITSKGIFLLYFADELLL